MTERVSPTSVPLGEVDTIAKLAHLELSPEESARVAAELGKILAYVQELAALDLTGVPPTAHVQLERIALRPDDPAPGLEREQVLGEAPKVSEGGFAVPTFVDEG
jgi:aspartyl-tRNA(Asn)/glutamyl-tRNA(Gln) amidotransferase subunit C